MDFRSNQAFLHKILFGLTFPPPPLPQSFFHDAVPFLSSLTLFQRYEHKDNSETVLIFQ